MTELSIQMQRLTTLLIEQIVSTIEDRIQLQLDKDRKEESNFLTRAGAAKYLHCSIATIDNKVKRGQLSKFKNGRTTLFKRQDLDNIVF
jgi:excisionase family DNA binding protein